METYVSQSGDTRHGQQHVPWLIDQAGSKEIGIESDSVDQGQRDDSLQPGEVKQLTGVSLSQEVVLQDGIECPADGHCGCRDGVVARLAHRVS